MPTKFDEIMNNVKVSELINKKKTEDQNKTFIITVLAVIGAIAAVAAIAYAVYRFMNPAYNDFDGSFDYDEFEDDFEDDEDIDDKDVYVHPSSNN